MTTVCQCWHGVEGVVRDDHDRPASLVAPEPERGARSAQYTSPRIIAGGARRGAAPPRLLPRGPDQIDLGPRMLSGIRGDGFVESGLLAIAEPGLNGLTRHQGGRLPHRPRPRRGEQGRSSRRGRWKFLSARVPLAMPLRLWPKACHVKMTAPGDDPKRTRTTRITMQSRGRRSPRPHVNGIGVISRAPRDPDMGTRCGCTRHRPLWRTQP